LKIRKEHVGEDVVLETMQEIAEIEKENNFEEYLLISTEHLWH
jgi:hypothetical protein